MLSYFSIWFKSVNLTFLNGNHNFLLNSFQNEFQKINKSLFSKNKDNFLNTL